MGNWSEKINLHEIFHSKCISINNSTIYVHNVWNRNSKDSPQFLLIDLIYLFSCLRVVTFVFTIASIYEEKKT